MPEVMKPSIDVWKINLILILAVFCTLLLVYNVYVTQSDRSDFVCSLSEEGVKELVLLNNLSLGLSDDQLDQISAELSDVIGASIENSLQAALEIIFSGRDGEGPMGEGTEIICEYTCEECTGQEDCEPTEDCVPEDQTCDEQSGLICCDNLLCNEQGICEEPDECVQEGKLCGEEYGLECCEDLDCENNICTSPCITEQGDCEEDSDCCETMTCDDGLCVPCECTETDSGNDPYTLGTTTGWWSASGECTSMRDSCDSVNNELREYYCGADGYIKQATHDCVCDSQNDVCEECEEQSGSCTDFSDCCDDLVCYHNYCEPCGQEGYGCDDAYGDTCCEGYECTNGVCQVPGPACEDFGGTCMDAADCCDDLVCNLAQCDYCVEYGYPCDDAYGDTCCEGYVCSYGSCTI